MFYLKKKLINFCWHYCCFAKLCWSLPCSRVKRPHCMYIPSASGSLPTYHHKTLSRAPWAIPGAPGGSDRKESACSAGDPGSIPVSGRPRKILCWEDLLEKARATHSSTLAWRTPWTEEPGGLQSMGSQSRLPLSDFTFTFFQGSLC